MESVLDSIKQVLGLEASYTPFDVDVIMHINAAFSILNQLGVGQEDTFSIADSDALWSQFLVPTDQLNLVKSYISLKVKFLFDPPTTSYLITAMKEQIEQFEWRLNMMREVLQPPVDYEALEEEDA